MIKYYIKVNGLWLYKSANLFTHRKEVAREYIRIENARKWIDNKYDFTKGKLIEIYSEQNEKLYLEETYTRKVNNDD